MSSSLIDTQQWSPLLPWLGLLPLLVYVLSHIFYNLYLHPLKNYPGPQLWTSTRLTYSYHSICGKLPQRVQELHTRYGPVVRVAPDELAFTHPEAWKDIYGYGQGRSQHVKDDFQYPQGNVRLPNRIADSDNQQHARLRRHLAHAFSAKALEEQQPLITRHVNLLMDQMQANHEATLDLAAWLDWTTFDMIGDLALGESFHCLENACCHPAVEMIMGGIRAGTWLNQLRRFHLDKLAMFLVPKELIAKREWLTDFSLDRIHQRIQLGSDRADLRPMPRSWWWLVAGGESTSTLLASVTYYLLKNPSTMTMLVREIRSAIRKDSDINLQSVAKLPYLLAVLEEGLRIHPAGAIIPARRITGDGATIAGHWVPPKTSVFVTQLACSHSADKFAHPTSFRPERWLPSAVPTEFEHDQRDAINPFSTGPRNCIGKHLAYMVTRLVLANLLWKFDVELVDDDRAHDTWLDQRWYIVWEKKPLLVKLTPVSTFE